MEMTDSFKVVRVNDNPVPSEMESGIIYILDNNSGKHGFLLCPCGCGDLIYLTFKSDNTQGIWNLSLDGDIPTVTASILRLDPRNCQSHFFITYGKVIWC